MRLPLLPALLLAATVALAGCGDDTDSSASEPATPFDEPSQSSSAPAAPGTAAGTGTPQGSAEPDDVTCEYTTDDLLPVAREVEPPPAEPTLGGDVPATLVTSLGDLTVTLDATRAPCTVNSFVSLATQGYYDDSPCHRLTTLEESGIAVLQCGDPTGAGTGGPGYTYPDELLGDEEYPAGTLAMANRGPDTNGSQFFIVYDDTPLPADYTVFGSVDPASLPPIQELAAQGTVPGEGGMTAPAEEVTVSAVNWG